jgi:hypothetical protein
VAGGAEDGDGDELTDEGITMVPDGEVTGYEIKVEVSG